MIVNLHGTKSNLQTIHPKPNYGGALRAGLQKETEDKNVRSLKET